MKKLMVTIFGSTGDLSMRKLLPALSRLIVEDQITKEIEIIAVGRRAFSNDDYRDYVQKNKNSDFDINTLKDVLTYYELNIDELSDYKKLKDYIDQKTNEDTVKLFYLAVAPELFPTISKNLGESHLVKKDHFNDRIIFEKPFGHSLDSANEIKKLLWQSFSEKQIYRIDHYLGKAMIQNIIMVRFANRIFEEIWHNRSIKKVQIIVKETDSILSRGAYYDKSGALIDMVQSHLLQMLSLVAMEVPLSYQSEDLKNEKVKVLDQIRFDQNVKLFGQYKGYLEEKDVHNQSKTETFVFLKAYVDTPRFKGVPFYLMTGKKLDVKASYIMIEFEETNEQRKWNLPLSTNKLYIKIDPLDGVSLVLNSKVPNLKDEVEQVELDFCSACRDVGNRVEAYQKLLLDSIEGHKTLFARWDEIEKSWTKIDELKKTNSNLYVYEDYEDLKNKIKREFNEEI
jgi:glucose-6-phosphate 1-dehydrogenase